MPLWFATHLSVLCVFSNNPEGLAFACILDGLCVYSCLHVHMPSMKGKASFWLPNWNPISNWHSGKPWARIPSDKPFCFHSLIRVKSDCDHEQRCTNQHLFLLFVSCTQKLKTFQSLSCPGFSATDGCQSSLPPPTSEISSQPDSDFTAVCDLGLKSRQEVAGDDEEEDSSYEELDSDSACSADSPPGSPVGIVGGKCTLWKGDCGTQRDIFQLGGELDLDQIERNWTFYRRF